MIIYRTVGTGLDADLMQIRESLGHMRFPAQSDEVLAELVRRRAPSRLLWHVGALPRTQRYDSLDDLCHQVALGPGTGAPPPPGR